MIYHWRHRKSTSPRWPLDQPMRFLSYNGETNTIQGNLNWIQSREASLKSAVWHGRENEICPFGNSKGFDSANLDSTVELVEKKHEVSTSADETLNSKEEKPVAKGDENVLEKTVVLTEASQEVAEVKAEASEKLDILKPEAIEVAEIEKATITETVENVEP